MSKEDNIQESLRWFDTAMSDYEAAKIMCENKKYAHACFLSQQSAEKALKALHYYYDSDPWGHSVLKLIDELKYIDIEVYTILALYTDNARLLDKLYIPTRYPNGLPDITPDLAYSKKDADEALLSADMILQKVKEIIAKR
ncbi:MAG TPA: HEPN domain-containing protein [Spirochaetota bacterium]|nr:HEPN domain-containing protein [Spirochaetota bacterium]HOM10837.1 HEPN domain-containing protein [Spirochaetota bacterium]HPP50709.1 HEPN domain-containing protein [Spirochaetota bacterium]HXK66388.1 HEPN domain-containing protein [Spirochaetota bacterium]